MIEKKTNMKIISDFLKTLAAVVTSTAVVGSALLWFMMPRVNAWVESITKTALSSVAVQSQTNTETLATITLQVAQIVTQIEELKKDPAQVREPALTFEPLGHRITNAKVGHRVIITWYFIKYHDCGAPQVAVFFRNGDDITHRFERLSIIDTDGAGVNMTAQPDRVQSITYSAVIPDDQDVRPGRARGWVTLRYPACPWSPPSVSPEVVFQILP